MDEIIKMIYQWRKGMGDKKIRRSLGFPRNRIRKYVRFDQSIRVCRGVPRVMLRLEVEPASQGKVDFGSSGQGGRTCAGAPNPTAGRTEGPQVLCRSGRTCRPALHPSAMRTFNR
jgi:hypothetical protein